MRGGVLLLDIADYWRNIATVAPRWTADGRAVIVETDAG